MMLFFEYYGFSVLYVLTHKIIIFPTLEFYFKINTINVTLSVPGPTRDCRDIHIEVMHSIAGASVDYTMSNDCQQYM